MSLRSPKPFTSAGLHHREVDLWSISMSEPLPVEAHLFDSLSLDERIRAAQFIAPGKRREFLTSRRVLRLLLAHYLELPPASIELCRVGNGKPALDASMAEAHKLSFNLSHTEGLLVVAIATGMEIGVDIEKIREFEGTKDIGARYFQPCERATLDHSPESFLRLWTCRESALKALGTGISAGWESIRIVNRSPGSSDAFGAGEPCHIQHFSPKAGYVGAVAAVGRIFEIRRIHTLELIDLESYGALNGHLVSL